MTQRITLNQEDFTRLVRGEIVTQGDLQVALQDSEHGEFEHLLKLDEGERQMLILAMAELALSRPGWDDVLQRVAQRIDNPGASMYSRLKACNGDRVRSERGPLLPQRMVLQQDDEAVRRWVHGINQGEPMPATDFLLQFSKFVCQASPENYPRLRPSILLLKEAFPKYHFTGVL